MKKFKFCIIVLLCFALGCDNICDNSYNRFKVDTLSEDTSIIKMKKINDSLICSDQKSEGSNVLFDTIIFKEYEDDWFGVSDEEWTRMRKKQILNDKKNGKSLEWVKVYYVDAIVTYDSIIEWYNVPQNSDSNSNQ